MYHTKKKPSSKASAHQLTDQCLNFLKPLLKQLDRTLDLRLVRTLANTVNSIVRHRSRQPPYSLVN
jgi:hypothetical protein